MPPDLLKAIEKAIAAAYESGRVHGYSQAKGGEVFEASAWKTDEGFGYDRWKADQYSMGKGTHAALIVILGPRVGQSSNAQFRDKP